MHYERERIPPNWHTQFEFIYIVKGAVKRITNGVEMTLEEGNGLFINSGILHGAQGVQNMECEYYLVEFLPEIFGEENAPIRSEYIDPLMRCSQIPFIVLEPSVIWKEEILHSVKQLAELSPQSNGFALKAMELIFQVCFTLYNQCKSQICNTENIVHQPDRLKDILTWIHQNYENKITTEKLSQIGNCSEGECYRMFKRLLHKSPSKYIQEYRLHRSLKLLKESQLSITEIAYQTGFSSCSYFSEIFHREIGYTPMEYRKKYFSSIL